MSQFIVFSDLHVHEHSIFTDTEDGENIYIKIVKSVMEQIRTYAKDNKIDKVVHTGDLFDIRNKIPVKLIALMLEELSKFKSTVYLLRGTEFHDGVGDNYNGRLFTRLSNAEVLSIPRFDEWDDDTVYFLPSYPKAEMLKQIEEWKSNSKRTRRRRIVFGHCALDGARTLSYESPSDVSLSKKDLSFFNFGFMGHYHKFQMVWENFFQVGSPYKIDFAEKDDPKGFLHYENGKVDFVPLDVPGMAQITIDGNGDLAKWDLSFARECFVKVVVNGNESFVKNFDQTEFKKKIPSALGVRFDMRTIEDNQEVRQVRIKKEDDPEKMLDRYLEFEEEAGQIGDLDERRLKRIGRMAMKGE